MLTFAQLDPDISNIVAVRADKNDFTFAERFPEIVYAFAGNDEGAWAVMSEHDVLCWDKLGHTQGVPGQGVLGTLFGDVSDQFRVTWVPGRAAPVWIGVSGQAHLVPQVARDGVGVGIGGPLEPEENASLSCLCKESISSSLVAN